MDVKLQRLIEQTLQTSKLSQRQLADKIGVSHGTINNVLAGSQPRSVTTLQKFADYFRLDLHQLTYGDGHEKALEDTLAYGLHPTAKRIMDLLTALDEEEMATLARCAEAFTRSTPDVRQHLIGQLKIIERLVHHEDTKDPPAHKAKGSG